MFKVGKLLTITNKRQMKEGLKMFSGALVAKKRSEQEGESTFVMQIIEDLQPIQVKALQGLIETGQLIPVTSDKAPPIVNSKDLKGKT